MGLERRIEFTCEKATAPPKRYIKINIRLIIIGTFVRSVGIYVSGRMINEMNTNNVKGLYTPPYKY